jgi:hypothetical protein
MPRKRHLNETPSTKSSQAEAIPAGGTDPTPPTAAKELPLFFDRLRQMTEDDWDRHLLYVYRRWPRINKDGGPHYLDKLRQPIDEQGLLERFGSGRYTLRLNSTAGKTLATYVVDLHNLAFPPKIEAIELLECTENERYLKLWPPKEKAAGKAEPDGSTHANSDPLTEAVKQLSGISKQLLARGGALEENQREILLDAHHRAIELVAEQAKGDGRTDQIELLDAILGVMDKLRPPAEAQPAPDPLALVERVLSIVDKLQGVRPEDSMMDAIERTVSLVEKVRSIAGDRDAASGSNSVWEKVGRIVGDAIAPLAPYVGPFLVSRFAGSPVAPPMSLPSPGPATSRPATDTTARPSPAQESEQAGGAPPAGEPPDPAVYALVQFMPYFEGPLLKFFNDGRTGAEFADWMIESYGQIAYAQASQLTPEQINKAFVQSRAFGPVIQTAPDQAGRFIMEFLHPETVSDEETDQAINSTSSTAANG